MLLWRHSYLSRASLQLLNRCPRVHGEMEQRGHFASTIFFHLAKLSGLAKELVEALAIHAITPLGTAKIRLCQEMLASSSATRAAIAPCTFVCLLEDIVFNQSFAKAAS